MTSPEAIPAVKPQSRGRAGERGQAVIVAVIAMAALLAIAAYAINTGEWWVHSHHLQVQADAAALAGATKYSVGCTEGSASDQLMEQTVAAYDGAGTVTTPTGTVSAVTPTGSASFPYNQQVYPTPSSANLIATINGDPCTDNALDVELTEENLSSLIPGVNPGYIHAESKVGFYEETTADKVEPFVFSDDVPSYMWVELVDENSTSTTGANPTRHSTPVDPCSVGDDGVNPTVVVGWAQLTQSESTGAWSGQMLPCPTPSPADPAVIPFESNHSSGTFPLGMRVITSAYQTNTEQSSGVEYPPQCPMEWGDLGATASPNIAWAPEGVVCYDIGPGNPGLGDSRDVGDGLTDAGAGFVRVYDNPSSSSDVPGYLSSSTASPPAPQADNVWLVPYSGSSTSTTDDCGSTEGTDSAGAEVSNFFSGAASVQLCAAMVFTSTGGTPMSCSNAGLDLYVDPSLLGWSYDGDSSLAPPETSMTCPNGASGSPNGVWYSSSVPLEGSGSIVSGPTDFSLDWTLSTGNVPTEYTTAGTTATAAANAVEKISGNSCSTTTPCTCTAGAYKCQGTTCTASSICAGSFDGDTQGAGNAELVQRAFDGASDQYQDSYSRSGPITSIDLYNNSSGTCSGAQTGASIQSVARTTTSDSSSMNLAVCISTIAGYADDTDPGASANDPVALNAGDDDFSGEFDCYKPTWGSTLSNDPAWGGSVQDSSPQAFNILMQWWVEKGCNGFGVASNGSLNTSQLPDASPPVAATPGSSDNYYYQVNSGSNTYAPASCASQPEQPSLSQPADCVEGVSDNDITWNIMAALNKRILGCSQAQCQGDTPNCNNYWNANNTLASLQDNPNDPRMVVLPITDYGQMFPNSYAPIPSGTGIPIMGFADFYITGWWGDPCTSTTVPSGVTALNFFNGTASNGTTLIAGTDTTPPMDTDATESVTADPEVDEGNYYENASGQPLGGLSSTTCNSTMPGYDITKDAISYCTDQGLLMGHFLQSVTVSGTGIPTTTVCQANSLDICTGVLEK